MLEDTERRLERLEAALRSPRPQKLVALPTVIEGYLQDLRETLDSDTDRARVLLRKLVGKVVLRRDGERLIADLMGNLPGLLNLDEREFGNPGAGRPSQAPSVRLWVPLVEPGRRIVA